MPGKYIDFDVLNGTLRYMFYETDTSLFFLLLLPYIYRF